MVCVTLMTAFPIAYRFHHHWQLVIQFIYLKQIFVIKIKLEFQIDHTSLGLPTDGPNKHQEKPEINAASVNVSRLV